MADAADRFWGGFFMASGALIVALGGTCTVRGLEPIFDLIAQSLRGDPSRLSDLPWLLLWLSMGSTTAFVGIVTFRAGLRMFRRPTADR